MIEQHLDTPVCLTVGRDATRRWARRQHVLWGHTTRVSLEFSVAMNRPSSIAASSPWSALRGDVEKVCRLNIEQRIVLTFIFRARAPYTKSEDQYLVQYIAKYNPEPSGRKGNTLYRTLEENVSDVKDYIVANSSADP